MEIDLNSKVAIVTGGSQGMGKAIVIGLVKAGAQVVVNYFPDDDRQRQNIAALEKEVGELTKSDYRLLVVPGDISLKETSVEIVEKTVEKFGEINVLVCNAGIYPRGEFISTSEDVYRKTLAVNLDGTYFPTQVIGAQMIKQKKGGSIVGISSMAALVGCGSLVHYGVAKAGSLSVMRSAAVALGEHGIRCNAVLPGTMDTEGNHANLQDPKYRDSMLARIPLGRFGESEDVVGPVLFFASDLSRYVTAAEILVDGGTLMFNQ